ncbi:MAG: type II toxin-antitoxin system RelE/ParE family toxin [Nitrospirae bacterium]|nr:type II toxin-antitoxin system RelE/ParE family toxin [Nitrospirota bacterium]MBF0534557.1 type II toxin-antitoxin system RelE/ParE family toxin [Nitrospirota bacterium]MBF0617592.1 type II toxin-antitoxin system RelE/ParE family toxin [Nitrospirota bacterium]
MPKLVYLSSAQRDIAVIAGYIESESANRAAAEKFIDKLTDYCEQIAKLPNMMGRARPEFGRNYRTVTFGKYVIFMRYADKDGPRSHLYIVHIVHGARDLEAYFIQHDDD